MVFSQNFCSSKKFRASWCGPFSPTRSTSLHILQTINGSGAQTFLIFFLFFFGGGPFSFINVSLETISISVTRSNHYQALLMMTLHATLHGSTHCFFSWVLSLRALMNKSHGLAAKQSFEHRASVQWATQKRPASIKCCPLGWTSHVPHLFVFQMKQEMSSLHCSKPYMCQQTQSPALHFIETLLREKRIDDQKRNIWWYNKVSWTVESSSELQATWCTTASFQSFPILWGHPGF